MPCDVPVLLSEMYYPHMYFYSNNYRRKLYRSCPHYRRNYRSYRGITAVPIFMSLFITYQDGLSVRRQSPIQVLTQP